MRKSLTKKERLSGKSDIEAVFENATKLEGKNVKLFYRPNGFTYNRILITVRRGFRTAVARNRQKRILREIYRNNKCGLKTGFDLAFILMREESSFDELRTAVTRLLQQAGLSVG